MAGWKIDVYSLESHRSKWENNRINGGRSIATFDLPEGTLMGISFHIMGMGILGECNRRDVIFGIHYCILIGMQGEAPRVVSWLYPP